MSLLEEIKRIFKGKKSPDIFVYPDNKAKYEYEEAQSFSNRHWLEYTAKELEDKNDVFSWLEPEAFCYCVPAVLKVSVEKNDPYLLSVNSVIHALSSDAKYWDDWYLNRWTLFTNEEYEVLQKWVNWIASFEDAFPDYVIARVIENLEILKTKLYK